MPAFILAIFLSAFLLFQVQPIVARYILPWYGGSPAVWTTCMLFFQVGLLCGYGWAHFLVSRFRGNPAIQVWIHVALLLISLVVLPITPEESLKPSGGGNPTLGIITLLMQTVGLPYLLISASGPLLQSWFGGVYPGRSPYRLYAISNAGSLLGLISYPFVFEPLFGLREQTTWWSWGYAIYGVVAAGCGYLLLRKSNVVADKSPESHPHGVIEKPLWLDRLLWVSYAACGSVMLIAATNQMCQDVAVVPFLWVLPLALYLTTFIIAFDREVWYRRAVWMPLMVIAVGALVYLLNKYSDPDDEVHLGWQIAIYMSALFTVCMVCHGEMVRLKPHPRYLTSFYLAVSLGGAIGGLLVGVVAPRVFDGYWELHLVLIAVGMLILVAVFMRGGVQWKFVAPGFSLIIAMAYFLSLHVGELRGNAIVTTRGFYGALRVYEEYWLEGPYRSLYHGRITHGQQLMSDEFRTLPSSYYTKESGVGVLLGNYPLRQEGRAIKFGCVGLGVGTIAAYAKPGDAVRFYEINDQIETIAREKFSYLDDCEGDVSVVIGDARITLEKEISEGEGQEFDLLFIDAFSGDSIPIHLLTKEAFALYFEHLKPDGALAIHITNLHLDLSDPVRNLAEEFGRNAVHIERDADNSFEYYSDWVIVTKNQTLLSELWKSDRLSAWWTEKPKPILWTDDYSNLLDVVVWED